MPYVHGDGRYDFDILSNNALAWPSATPTP
jgi:hypothetical protein